jgi:hypothetical protein
MTPEQVADLEINRFATAVRLSQTQKAQLIQFLNTEYCELLKFMRKNTGISRDDLLQRLDIILNTCRSRVTEVLSQDQLAAWDNEMERSKQVLGDELAA